MPSKKYGPRIDLRRKNSSGVGKSAPVTRTKLHVNLKTCRTCGAKPGQTCFRLTGKSFTELQHTHSGQEVRQDEYVEKSRPLTADEMAERQRKRSTPQLDRLHASRQGRSASRKQRLNGG